ncbi:hypothetical protein [Oleiphilus messinensis]|nr:hypothetical protein [Oleiphilus messinensis]
MSKSKALSITGWSIYAHPLFLDEYEVLAQKVEVLKAKDSINFHK